MTQNKINSQCPNCNCSTADVLCKTFEARKDGEKEGKPINKVIVKCTAKNHQYSLDPKGKNTEWKKFFK